MKNVFQKYGLLLAILLLASVVRIAGLSSVPPSLYWEEVALGYDAYSILHTGKDFHGNSYPIVAFPSFGDFKPSLYIYLIVPFIPIFGLNEWSVRLPSVLAGILTVSLVFLLGSRWKKSIGLWSAFLFAIQPWSIQISRTGFETNVATALMTAGIWFGLNAKGKLRNAFLAVLCLCLAMYTYHASKIVAPLLGMTLVIYWLRTWEENLRQKGQKLFLIGIVAGILVSPIARSLNSPEVRQRADETSIFAGAVLAEKSNALIQSAGGDRWAKLIHHRYIVGTQMIAHQYIRNFDPVFLFLKGDGNPRHSSGIVGIVYPWEVVTVLLGLLAIWKSRKADQIFLIGWLLIAGIPASVTTVSPHALRFLAAAPVFALLSGIGIDQIVRFLPKKKSVTMCIVLLGLSSLAYFFRFMWTEHRVRFSESFQYGYRELYEVLENEKKPNDRIAVTRQEGRPSMYYLFFTKQDPRVIQEADPHVRKDQQELLEVGQYSFVDTINLSAYSLFATSAKHVPVEAHTIKEIRRLDGSLAWVIWRKS